MDKSNGYIEMCDCDDIQNRWKEPEDGDFFLLRSGDYGCSDTGVEFSPGIHTIESGLEFYGKPNTVWLPRQDQLQEMVFIPTFWCWTGRLDKFNQWCDSKVRHETMINHCKSLEQLWLSFVMESKYNKVWKNDGWESR